MHYKTQKTDIFEVVPVLYYTVQCTVYNRLGQFVSNQKFEIEEYTVCGKLILPKNFIHFLAQLACEFAWICEYLQASCIQHF